MSLVLTRVDNRLIHGQVLEAWVPTLNANCIIVANDKIANTAMQKLLMEASVPRGIRVIIGAIDEVAEILESEELDNARILLLFATSGDALTAYRQGVHFERLNLGNMHAGVGKVKCSCTIALDDDDVVNLKQIDAAGIRVFSQCVPSDKAVEWQKMLRFTKS